MSEGKIKIGDVAPDFTLPSQSGEMVSLKNFFGKKPVVLYFYPKDESAGCTAEACAFRDSYEIFKKYDAEVIGVSSDTVESHKLFAAHHKLPFILLSDEDGKIRKLYGVSKSLAMLPGRVTFIIDRNGIVRHIFSSQLNPKKHIEEAIKTLKAIQEIK